MTIFKRIIEEKIIELLFKNRAILIFGPRQSGKTTLAQKIISEFGVQGAYFNCEASSVRKHFVLGEPKALKELVTDKKIVVFDEAQTIQNIGAILKIFIDTYPDTQIIATGSSSFDLANKINEPLTGRAFEFILYPLSLSEIRRSKQISKEDLFEYMRLGTYPAIVGEENKVVRENFLKNITTNYLYKDIYIFESIRNPQLFEDLLKLLAHQIGQMVSVYELAQTLKTSRTTIEKYLKLLEQSYVIKKVRSFSHNHRNELRKAFKIFFLDVGVRNAIIDQLDPLEVRTDKGFLFENFFFLELLKIGSIETFPPVIYFWRTTTKLEIDFIVTKGSTISAYECKWKDTQVVFTQFLKLYPQGKVQVVTPELLLNYE
ncbi:MAG: ATP-binding protein [Candidatus Staskawiczbacteria bacterium]|nr:ATP-binding protein [Candidatus Staskawiczbacteria bacterium]